MNYTVFGIFTDKQDARDAIAHLQEDGYSPKDISLLMKDTNQVQEITQSTGTHVAGSATSGIAAGAVLGGLAGLLIGVGALAIPGIGAFLVVGPLAAAMGLTGAAATTVSGAATGAVAGGLLGALVGLGVPERQARVYEDRLNEGGILVAVYTETDAAADEVRDIMDEYNASNIDAVEGTERMYRHHEHSRGLRMNHRGVSHSHA